MLIKNIYAMTGDPYHNIIEMPDGKLYTFLSTPYRQLTEGDLSEVQTPLNAAMYLKAVHAVKFDECFNTAAIYGLETDSSVKSARTETLNLRITPGLKAALVKAAGDSGRTVSNYVERVLEDAVKSN